MTMVQLQNTMQSPSLLGLRDTHSLYPYNLNFALIIFVNLALNACLFLLALLLGIKLEQSWRSLTLFPMTANRFQASVKAVVQALASSAKEDHVSAVCGDS
jgi:hypothetical protein